MPDNHTLATLALLVVYLAIAAAILISQFRSISREERKIKQIEKERLDRWQ